MMTVPDPDSPTRSVLITGASRGIGRATADAFAAAGWQVVAGVRDRRELAPFSDAGVEVVEFDVTEPNEVRAGVAAAEGLVGGSLACVVNNAGWALFGAVEDVDIDLARREFETNLFGAVAVLQAALPAMRRVGAGVVVNVSTLSGRIPLPLFGMYSASKLALAAVSEALALELETCGIRVVLLEAGVVRTDFARSTVISGAAGGGDPLYGTTRDRILGTLRGIRDQGALRPEDVAHAIVRAAGDSRTPFRVVLEDPGLAPLAKAVGGPDRESHEHVRRFFGLDAVAHRNGPP